jgi:hypothetical protein
LDEELVDLLVEYLALEWTAQESSIAQNYSGQSARTQRAASFLNLALAEM